ncbi:MAG: hypothetical protein GY694_10025 [Gammaproteobacteria bacterium]|nr:hypothetical protein [Gammaproteobacteria bacterium]
MTSDSYTNVLIHDNNFQYPDEIKLFCDQNQLTPLKAKEDNVMEILQSCIDLSAFFIGRFW